MLVRNRMFGRATVAGALAACLAIGVAGPAAAGSLEGKLVRLVNRARAVHDLRALKPSDRLSVDAERHTRVMIERGELSHPGNLLQLLKPYDWDRVGASVVGCAGTARMLVRAWLHSEVHRSILLNPQVERIGMGAIRAAGSSACGRDRIWATGIVYG